MQNLHLSRSIALAAFTVILGLVGSGCSNGGTEEQALTQFKEGTLKTAKTNQDRMRELFKKAGGTYSNLTPEEKAEFVKLNNGSEPVAQQAWGYLSGEGKRTGVSNEQKAGHSN